MREERDQLKKDSGKDTAVEGSEGNKTQTDEKQIESASGDKSNPTMDVPAKYEALKSKYHVSN